MWCLLFDVVRRFALSLFVSRCCVLSCVVRWLMFVAKIPAFCWWLSVRCLLIVCRLLRCVVFSVLLFVGWCVLLCGACCSGLVVGCLLFVVFVVASCLLFDV